MTAWLRGLLRDNAEMIAQVSAGSTPGRTQLLDVVDSEAAKLVAEPHAIRRHPFSNLERRPEYTVRQGEPT
ncbi:MAG: hypothetical protein KKC79_09345 [Gammaproteobacteria bacterium]|nr:hypothetical protein [Gammaproteobacteria bacterium]MBU1442802.1 hypothetical protein [Gammaproteobacteria bacterium]MBU2286947.1 hypothetical protein [Gammaproteobacteria bacterium]MBU2408838.1 hypothetical protein [Gammaproteobacteria bacterium]